MFTLKKGHQPGVYVPLRALFLVFIVVPWLYLGNSQVSVYRTIGPTLVLVIGKAQFRRAMLSCDSSCYLCRNKGTDQLRCYHAADQRLCFHYIDSKIPLLQTWSETPKSRFSCVKPHI